MRRHGVTGKTNAKAASQKRTVVQSANIGNDGWNTQGEWQPAAASAENVAGFSRFGLDGTRSPCGAALLPPPPSQVVQERLLFWCQARLHTHDRQVADILSAVLHLSLLRLQIGHSALRQGSRIEPITLKELLGDA
jgi:hypothetical protein